MHISVTNSLFLDHLLEVIVILLVAGILNVVIRSFIKVPKVLQNRPGKKYFTIAQNTISLIVAIIVLYAIFLILDINITPLLASIGLIGVVTAIVANSVFNDVIAGFFLLSQTNITVGDYVNIGGTNIAGNIVRIGIRNMILRGDDGSTIVIPNGQVRTILSYPTGMITLFSDITVKLDQSLDDILSLFSHTLEICKKEKPTLFLPNSEIIGIKKLDLITNSITITTQLVTPTIHRLHTEPTYFYRIYKAFESRTNKAQNTS